MRAGSILVERVRQTPTMLIAVSAMVLWFLSAAYMFHFGASWHLDLRVYRAAGNALRHGGSPFTSNFTSNRLPFTYTPFALLILTPLSFGSLGLVEAAWWTASAVCLVCAAWLMIRSAFSLSSRRAWAVAALLGAAASLGLEPVRSNFNYGQINLILMLMIVADVTWVRPPRRGVLVGVGAAIKLTPLVFLLFFIVDQKWRAFWQGIGTFGAVAAISWAVLPSDSARYWFHEVTNAGRTGALGTVSNQSWNGLVHRTPFHGGHLGTAVWLILSLATLACGAGLARWLVMERQPAQAVLALALTEVLVSPVSWTHHWSWLALSPIVIVSIWTRHRSVGIALLVVLAIGVSAPYLWVGLDPLSYVARNALVISGAVALLIWFLAEAQDHRNAPPKYLRWGASPESGAAPSATLQ